MKRRGPVFVVSLICLLSAFLSALTVASASLGRLKSVSAALRQTDPDAARAFLEAFLEEPVPDAPDAAEALGFTDRYYGFVVEKAVPAGTKAVLAALVFFPVLGFAGLLLYEGRREKKDRETLRARVTAALDGKERFDARSEDERLVSDLIGRVRIAEEGRFRRETELKTYVENVAHGVKTPLAALTLKLDLLRQETGESAYLADAEREAERIRRYLSSLLTSARIESGRVRFQWERLDFLALVREVLSDYGDAVFLRTEESGAYNVRGDREWLDDAVSALLQNGVRDGEGEATAALTASDLSVRLTIENGGSVLSLPPERLTERYFVPVENGSSTGVGLSVVKAVAEAHGGTLVLRPKATGGMLAVLTLPRLELREKL